MKLQRLPGIAALTMSLGLLVLFVGGLSVAPEPTVTYAAPLDQVENPCGYEFEITVMPPAPTIYDVITLTYDALWPNGCVPIHHGHQMAEDEITLDAVREGAFTHLCPSILTPWGGEASIGPLASGDYTVSVYLTSEITPYPPVTERCGVQSFTVYTQAQEIHYVALSGVDAGVCTDADAPCRTVQYAIDQATEGAVIKVAAGTYTDLHARARHEVTVTDSVTQVAYISKSLTLRGGYTVTHWYVSDPVSYPTTLDAQGGGRVLYITGADAVEAVPSITVEDLRLTGGDSDVGTDAADQPGGGMYAISATVTLSGCQVVSNTANQFLPYGGAGGGIYLTHSPGSVLSTNIIQANEAWYGGGVYLQASDHVTLTGNIIQENAAHGWYGAAGGGVYVHKSAHVLLVGNTLRRNTAQVGGGVALLESDHVILNGNAVLSNTAGGSHTFFEGGGISVWESDGVILTGNLIRENASEEGGGVTLLHSNHAVLDNNVIADNQSWYASGSGLYIAGSTAALRHTTFARNLGASGLYVADVADVHSTVALTNTILVSHTTGVSVTSGSTATLAATLWGAGMWANRMDCTGKGTIITGAPNLWGDPAFVAPDVGDYHIRATSAALHAGIDAGVHVDMDGQARADGHPDIGADEFQSVMRVTKHASAPTVRAGDALRYTIRITNTGSTGLNAVITDTLPLSVMLGEVLGGTAYLPRGAIRLPNGRAGITWTASIPAPAGVWTATAVVTVDAKYVGLLTNIVNVTTEEGAAGMAAVTSMVMGQHAVYLPLVLR